MAVTPAGTPYVESSDNVADYPGVSLALANHIDDTAGKVLQVVSTAKTDTFSTSSASMTDLTGVSQTITPSSTSNKILVIVSISYGYSTTGTNPRFLLLRNSTAICVGGAAGSRPRFTTGGNSGADVNAATLLALSSIQVTFLDSPATTSSVTYKMQGASSAGVLYLNRSGTDADNTNSVSARAATTITLMELSA